MERFKQLESDLSDILLFDGDIGVSRSGLIRLVFDRDIGTATLSLALPRGDSSTQYLVAAVATIFTCVLLPNYPKKVTIFEESINKFADGRNGKVYEKSTDGSLNISYDRDAYVYELSSKLVLSK